jgi:hypothetical protein
VPWQVFLSEMTGTPVLLLGGLSLVILAFGAGSPIAALVPSVKLRQMIGIGRFAIGGAYRESAVNRGRSTAEPPRV